MAAAMSCEKHSIHFEGVMLFSVSFWAQKLYLKGIYIHYKLKGIYIHYKLKGIYIHYK